MVEILLNEGLIACANIAPEVESHYVWQGQPCCEPEIPVWMKISPTTLEAAKHRIRLLHPYEVPAILEWPVIANADYSTWAHSSSLPASSLSI